MHALIDWFKLLRQELFAEKTRIILTILALVWGTTSITMMLAIGEGIRSSFVKAMSSVGSNIIYAHGGTTSRSFKGQTINQPTALTPEDYQAIKSNLKHEDTLSAEYNVVGQLQAGTQQTSFASIRAVEPIYGEMRNITIQAPGRFITPLDADQHRRVIVLGDKIAPQLFPHNNNPIGQTLFLSGTPLQVIGVMQPKAQLVTAQMPDSYQAWIPATTYFDLAQPQTIDSIVIAMKDLKHTAEIEQQVRQFVALHHGVDPEDPAIVTFEDYSSMQEKTDLLFTGLEIFLGVVGILTLLVAGIGISNVMLISIANATKNIGIRMAMGARSHQILLHYLVEALLVTASGGVLGFLLSFMLITLLNLIPLQGKIFELIGKPHPVLSFSVFFSVITCLGIIGFLAGFFPAWRAASINPAQALRYEK